MPLFTAKGIADNAAGTIVASLLIAAVGVIGASFGGFAFKDVVFVAVCLFAVAELVFMLIAIRLSQRAQPLEVIGKTIDGVTVVRVDGFRIVELDTFGAQSFEKLDTKERDQFRRLISTCARYRYSRYDFTQMFSNQGKPLVDEAVYAAVVPGKSTQFWTRTEFDNLPQHERDALKSANAYVWEWYTGERAARRTRSLVEADALLADANRIMDDLRVYRGPGLLALGRSVDLADPVPYWQDRVEKWRASRA